jgi:hypothetical protein
MSNKNMSKEVKLANALKAGKVFTSNQIRTRFGLNNPYAAIANVRDRQGVNVNKTVTKVNGVNVIKYSNGTATRSNRRKAA